MGARGREAVILVLELVGESAGLLGRDSRFLFKSCGGTIGYGQDNAWTVPHPSLPDTCAFVDYAREGFALTSSGDVRVAFGSRESLLVPLQPYPLRNGATIFIGALELRATLLDDEGLPVEQPDAKAPR